jgi:hypothetical protein
MRMVGAVSYGKLVCAAALLLVYALGGELSAVAVTAAVTLLLIALCAVETTRDLAADRDARASTHA